MTHKWIWTVWLTVTTQLCLAQFGTCDMAKLQEATGRKLIVVTELDSPRLIELLRKKRKTNEIELYKQSVARYNKNLQEVVEKYWPLSKDVQYMTFQEADRIRKAKSTEYVVLYCAHIENFTTRGDEGARHYSGLVWPENFTTVNVKRDHWDMYAVMELKLIEELGKHTPIFKQNLANIIPDKADLVFGMQMLRRYVQENGDRNKTTEMQDMLSFQGSLSDSTTLLIRKDWLHPYINVNSVKGIYPYPYRVVDSRTYESMVGCAADSGYAYIEIIPEVLSKKAKIKVNYLHLVLNAADGTVLAAYSPGGSEEDGKIITKSALKEYTRQERNGNKR